MRSGTVVALLALAACVAAVPISELMAEKLHPVPFDFHERPLNSNGQADRIQAHIIAHTHDDVGWLKTPDEYFYGANQSIQRAGVQYVSLPLTHKVVMSMELKAFISMVLTWLAQVHPRLCRPRTHAQPRTQIHVR
jgi:hypothetical protein